MTPIINSLLLSADARDEWCDDYLNACDAIAISINVRPVEAHKTKLGRQASCMTSCGRRHWVWETLTWQVHVSNDGGIVFSVSDGSTVEQALEAWADYKRRMGLVNDD